jgi:arabinogalactan oligomer/maltooligosaccharide transport system permease protein
MPIPKTDIPPTPTPLYWRVASAVVTVVIAAVVGAAALGLSRHGDGRDHRLAVESSLGQRVSALAKVVAESGPDAAKGFAEGNASASIHVVSVGGTDEFGISTGTTVSFERFGDPRAKPVDTTAFAQDLLNRSAELDDYTTRGQPIPESRRFAAAELAGDEGLVVYAAFSAVVKGGEYQALVRVSEVVETPSPTIPTSNLLIGLLIAALLGLGISWLPRKSKLMLDWGDRIGLGLAAGLAMFVTFVGSGRVNYLLWSVLVAAGLAFIAGRSMARVFRGVREQPGTYLYIVPAMIGMIVLVFVPFIMGVALAFFSGGEFAGVDNFTQILSGTAPGVANFYWTTGFTILWTVSNVVLHVGIGVALALVLNRENLAFKTGYRMLLVVPWAVPNYITALIWKSMFNPQFGAVNGLLDVFGVENINWLGAGSTFWSNYIAALTTNTWLGFPFMMVVTLGALQSIPKDLYEAADIDGANRWQKFKQVTLPLLKPALVPAIILGVVWTFNMFNVIYLVSGGAPENQTNILITEAYYAFKVLGREELAAAYSLLIFFMLLAYGWMQNRVTRATEGAFE